MKRKQTHIWDRGRSCCCFYLLGNLFFLLVALHAQGDTFKLRGRTFQVGPNPSAIVVGDLNMDGWPEIITADRGEMTDSREERPANDELSLLLAQGELEYVKHHPSLKTGFSPYAIALANIDAMKWPDIIVANFLTVRHRDISLFLNLQEENIFKPFSFRIPQETLSYYRQLDGDDRPIFTQPGLTSMVVYDFNSDGLRDLVATGWSSDVLAIFPGNSENHFGEPHFLNAKGAPCDIALADFDKDGKKDIVTVMEATGELVLWKGDGALGFEPQARFLTRGKLPHRVRVADMNQDGMLDLIVSHRYNDDSLVIFYGDGKYQFSVSQEIMLGKDRELLEKEVRDIVVSDFNGDGMPDIAAACFAAGEVAVLLNKAQKDLLHPVFTRERYRFKEARPRALCVGDFDKNGHNDIAVALWDENVVALLMNQAKK